MTAARADSRRALAGIIEEMIVEHCTADRPKSTAVLAEAIGKLLPGVTLAMVKKAAQRARADKRIEYEHQRWVWTDGAKGLGYSRPAGWVRVAPTVEVSVKGASLTVREVP